MKKAEKPAPDTRLDYPRMLFRFPGKDAQLQDGSYGTLIVGNDDEHAAALEDAWYETPAEARVVGDKAKAKVDAKVKADNEAKALADAKALIAASKKA